MTTIAALDPYDEIDAYKRTVDTLADIIREIRNRIPDESVVDEVLDEFGIEIQYDACA